LEIINLAEIARTRNWKWGLEFMMESVIDKHEFCQWLVGWFCRTAVTVYDVWILDDVLIENYVSMKGETRIRRFGCGSVQEKSGDFPDMYAPPGGAWTAAWRPASSGGLM